MGMPLPEVVEASIVGTRSLDEPFQFGSMVFRTAHEMRRGARRAVDREIDHAEMIRSELLAHQDPANLSPAGLLKMRPETDALITG